MAEPGGATEVTREANAAVLEKLPFDDTRSFDRAQRGFIAPLLNDGKVVDAAGEVIFDAARFAIPLDQPAPETVNPSQWRQAQLNGLSGLFEVSERIYQVRGIDLAVITFIEGETGVIVMDPLTTMEPAAAALALYYEHRPQRAVVAVIYTHSHIDHFGGVRGVLDEEAVLRGEAQVIAPEHFTEEAVSENLMAGNVMTRRSHYQYGALLPTGAKGTLGTGLGAFSPRGTATLIRPTHEITRTGETLEIDGLTFEFLLAPGSEAPAAMHFFIRELQALCVAENATQTLHNFYTLRGAKTRDSRRWVRYLNETLDMWGDQVEVLFAPHHWPVWGNDQVVEHIENYRDVVRYIHDQSLRLANLGYTMDEIGDMVELPPALARNWSTRGYYGSISHNALAVYNFYLGYYSANPADLHRHPPAELAVRYVEAMGGADAVIEKGRAAFDEGDYRWAAELLKHVVYADPANQQARNLQADTLEQLGYQAENNTWRNAYLTGALELRQGMQRQELPSAASPDFPPNMPLDLLFDYLAIRLDGPRAADQSIAINFEFTEPEARYGVTVRNGVMNTRRTFSDGADATLRMPRSALNDILLGQATFEQQVIDGHIEVEGDAGKLGQMLSLLDDFDL